MIGSPDPSIAPSGNAVVRAQKQCENRGGRPRIRVPNSPYGLCGRKAKSKRRSAQELCESRGGRPRLLVPDGPYGLRGRKATLNRRRAQELCESRGGRTGLRIPD